MKNSFAQLFLILLILIVSCSVENPSDEKYVLIHKKIDSIRIANQIPAIAYGVIQNDDILIQKVIGYRNIETKEKVEINDLFNIASNTKSYVSFIAGKSVEKGLINWDTKFFLLFPELLETSNEAYKGITLQDLLSHRARLIPFQNESETYPIIEYERSIDPSLPIEKKKYYFIKQILSYDPIPILDDEDERYSNAGYIAALLMLEKSNGKTWDQLLNDLKVKTGIYCQNGWPDKYSQNQPKGHIKPEDWLIDSDKVLIAIPPILKKYHYFNQFFKLVAPLSISLPDFLKFLKLHIQGLNGQDNYLLAETYDHIFNCEEDYALGWSRKLFDKKFYHHRGGVATFCSIALINPETNIGIVVMFNNHSNEGMDDIVKFLDDEFAKAN